MLTPRQDRRARHREAGGRRPDDRAARRAGHPRLRRRSRRAGARARRARRAAAGVRVGGRRPTGVAGSPRGVLPIPRAAAACTRTSTTRGSSRSSPRSCADAFFAARPYADRRSPFRSRRRRNAATGCGRGFTSTAAASGSFAKAPHVVRCAATGQLSDAARRGGRVRGREPGRRRRARHVGRDGREHGRQRAALSICRRGRARCSDEGVLTRVRAASGLTGCACRGLRRRSFEAGEPAVTIR